MAQNLVTNLDEIPRAPATEAPVERPSVSLFRKRLRKFRALQRGYYSFLILTVAYGISFFLPVLINNDAFVVRYEGRYYFPLFQYYQASEFGQEAFGEKDRDPEGNQRHRVSDAPPRAEPRRGSRGVLAP